MPSTADELLDDLRRDGFTVTLRGSKIAIAPHAKLTPAAKAEIRQHREAIVELLHGSPAKRLPPAPPAPKPPPATPPWYRPDHPFWGDAKVLDAIEDMKAAIGDGGEDRFKGF